MTLDELKTMALGTGLVLAAVVVFELAYQASLKFGG
jgi:hypothetical protein